MKQRLLVMFHRAFELTLRVGTWWHVQVGRWLCLYYAFFFKPKRDTCHLPTAYKPWGARCYHWIQLGENTFRVSLILQWACFLHTSCPSTWHHSQCSRQHNTFVFVFLNCLCEKVHLAGKVFSWQCHTWPSWRHFVGRDLMWSSVHWWDVINCHQLSDTRGQEDYGE